jgi:putative PEP-CTERM system TPR-repeat lipoprotein
MATFLEAVIDAQRGKYKDADALLDRLRGTIGRFPEAYLVASEIKFRLNQLDQAQEFAKRSIAQAGDQPRAYQLISMIALKRGDLEGAIAALERAVQLAPNDAGMLGTLGQTYIAHGDMEKAKAVFGRAALAAPNNPQIATARAIAEYATGDRQAGVTGLSRVFNAGKGSVLAGPPLVIEALQIGQIDVAEEAAGQLVAHDPHDPSYQELMAAVRIAQHDYAGAEKLLRSVLARSPNLSSARRDLLEVYLVTNRIGQARQLYLDRLKAKPDDIESLEALADLAFHEKNDAEAIRLLTQAQNATPHDPKPSLRILALLEARKKWPEAIGRSRGLAAKFPNDVSVQDALAHLYWASGNHAAAQAAYKAAIARFPNYAPIFSHYAAVFVSDRNYAAAAPLALRAVKLDPRSVDLKRAYVSLVYLANGADAAFFAAQAVMGDKSGAAAALIAADVLEANNNRVAAIALLEKRQAQNPSTALAVRLAMLYQANNAIDKALLVLEPWAAGHPKDVEARFALAQVESAAGKVNQALNQYEWLAVQKPDNAVVLNNLAWLYDLKHDPRARATAEKAVKFAPASGSVADTLGWIVVEQGDPAGAMKYLAQASASQPANATIQYHYAFALSKTGRADEARDILQKLLKKNPRPDTKSAAETLLTKLGGR